MADDQSFDPSSIPDDLTDMRNKLKSLQIEPAAGFDVEELLRMPKIIVGALGLEGKAEKEFINNALDELKVEGLTAEARAEVLAYWRKAEEAVLEAFGRIKEADEGQTL